MRRRELLKGMTAAAIGMCLKSAVQEAWAEEPEQQVKTVYVIYKCHLDVGFTDTEHGVIRTYFDDYLPRAMDTAETLRRFGRRGTLCLDDRGVDALPLPGAGLCGQA